LFEVVGAVGWVVLGVWGFLVVAGAVTPVYDWLVAHGGWIPFFAPPVSGTGRTILTVAIVLAVMIIPIITAVSREVFLQTPLLHEEAALALGATRWEMIQMAVIPFGRPGMISAAMLGLGRALGETMVVAMVLSPSPQLITFVLTSSQNSSTIAGNIALNFPEAHGVDVNGLIATGLILFAITLVINSIARVLINRRKAFSGAN
jgi:phosphate transport system permease protein